MICFRGLKDCEILRALGEARDFVKKPSKV